MRAPKLKEIAPWTYRFIWINVILFVIGQIYLRTSGFNPILNIFALQIGHLFEGKLWELFTYMWVHSDYLFVHILFNMMTLYFLGRVVEHQLGGKAFLWVYLVGGLASVGLFLVDIAVQGLVFGQSVNLNEPLVGASGAVCALLGVFSLLAPNAKLFIMFLPWPVRAVKMVRGFAWFSAAAMVLGWIPVIGNSESLGWFFSVAHSAHLGGILFGWWFIRKIQASQQPEYMPYRVVTEPPKAVPPDQMNAFELRQALDPILDKISSEGIESLTREERQILEQGRRLFD
ncbi:MAG: rhomboid family intramembrane serine protease [Verrucomicrobiota bacterium]